MTGIARASIYKTRGQHPRSITELSGAHKRRRNLKAASARVLTSYPTFTGSPSQLQSRNPRSESSKSSTSTKPPAIPQAPPTRHANNRPNNANRRPHLHVLPPPSRSRRLLQPVQIRPPNIRLVPHPQPHSHPGKPLQLLHNRPGTKLRNHRISLTITRTRKNELEHYHAAGGDEGGVEGGKRCGG